MLPPDTYYCHRNVRRELEEDLTLETHTRFLEVEEIPYPDDIISHDVMMCTQKVNRKRIFISLILELIEIIIRLTERYWKLCYGYSNNIIPQTNLYSYLLKSIIKMVC